MNVATVPKTRMEVGEFLAWSAELQDVHERYELVDGEVVAMAGDTIQHNRAKASAWRALDDAARSARLSCIVVVDGVGVKISERTVRIPDVMVQCGGSQPAADAMLLDRPQIVLEVVSPSSRRDDHGIKLVDYLTVPSVEHYLIVLTDQRAIVHHRRGTAGEILTRILRDGDIALEPPGLTVSVADLLGPVPTTDEETLQ